MKRKTQRRLVAAKWTLLAMLPTPWTFGPMAGVHRHNEMMRKGLYDRDAMGGIR